MIYCLQKARLYCNKKGLYQIQDFHNINTNISKSASAIYQTTFDTRAKTGNLTECKFFSLFVSRLRLPKLYTRSLRVQNKCNHSESSQGCSLLVLRGMIYFNCVFHYNCFCFSTMIGPLSDSEQYCIVFWTPAENILASFVKNSFVKDFKNGLQYIWSID